MIQLFGEFEKAIYNSAPKWADAAYCVLPFLKSLVF